MGIRGNCHCGATAFELKEAPTSVTRCTCTFCAKRGALWAHYRPEQVTFTSKSELSYYSTRPDVQKHYFCSKCGCTTFSDTPVWENFEMVEGKRNCSINARLLEDIDVDAIPVTVIDGKNLW
jgi:hypothetical protein